MVTRRKATDEQRSHAGRVIPFRHAKGALPPPLPLIAKVVPRSRTLRPADVILLLPLIAPVTAAILLGLLGWFMAWLAIVGTLVAATVFADLARAVQWRLYGAAVQPHGSHLIGNR
jgi:hypothetical protein